MLVLYVIDWVLLLLLMILLHSRNCIGVDQTITVKLIVKS